MRLLRRHFYFNDDDTIIISLSSRVPSEHHVRLFCAMTPLSCSPLSFLQAAPEYIPEKVKKAEKKLEENPYDLDAWSILIREAQV